MKGIKIIMIFFVALQIACLINALTIKDVSKIPSQVEPGGSVKLNLKIKNNLEDDVEDVKVSLNLNDVPFAPAIISEDYFEEIESDDSVIADFDLIAESNAEAGTYKIPVSIEYKINDETKVEFFTISLTINAKPNLILNTEGFLLKGQKNELKIRVTNTGLGKAKLLEVELQESGAYKILSSKNVYIGDLDSDDFDTAIFNVFLKDQNVVNFPVVLKYRDSSNKQFVEIKNLAARVYSNDEAIKLGLIKKNNIKFYFTIVIFLIILFVVWRKIRKWGRRRRAIKNKEI